MLFIWSFCGLLQKNVCIESSLRKSERELWPGRRRKPTFIEFPLFTDKNIYSCTMRTKKRQEVASQANVHTYMSMSEIYLLA